MKKRYNKGKSHVTIFADCCGTLYTPQPQYRYQKAHDDHCLIYIWRVGLDMIPWDDDQYHTYIVYIISYLKIISYSIKTNYQNEVWIGLVTEHLTRLTTYKATTNNLNSKNTKHLDTTVNIGKQTSYESALQQEGQSLTVWLSAEIWRQILPRLDTKWNFVSQINSHIIATYYLSRKWHNSKKMHLN